MTCKPSGKCEFGFYLDTKGKCIPFPQQCIPPTSWNGIKCEMIDKKCPNGTYYS